MSPRFPAILIATFGIVPLALPQAVDEYQMKAAFLFNFARFVEWPDQAFKTPADPFTICVLGNNPFGHQLDATVNGKTVGGRKIVARAVADLDRAAGCQILFIAARQKKQWRDAASLGVLTVGEADDFASSGGVVGLIAQDGRIRIEINAEAADQRKLRISSKLLSLAKIVKTEAK